MQTNDYCSFQLKVLYERQTLGRRVLHDASRRPVEMWLSGLAKVQAPHGVYHKLGWKHARQDSNLQPSVPKTDALSN